MSSPSRPRPSWAVRPQSNPLVQQPPPRRPENAPSEARLRLLGALSVHDEREG